MRDTVEIAKEKGTASIDTRVCGLKVAMREAEPMEVVRAAGTFSHSKTIFSASLSGGLRSNVSI